MAAKKKTTEKPIEGVAAKLGLGGVMNDQMVTAAINGMIAGVGAHVASKVLAKSLPPTDPPPAEAWLFPTAEEGDGIFVTREQPAPSGMFLGVLERNATMADVVARFGGGVYAVALRSGKGQRQIKQRRTIQIAGAPKSRDVRRAIRKMNDIIFEMTSGEDPLTKGDRVEFLRALGFTLRERFTEIRVHEAADILESIDS